jgi:hypothetical protein
VKVPRAETTSDERGTLFKVVLTGLMSFPPPLSSVGSSFLAKWGPGGPAPLTIFIVTKGGREDRERV